MTRKIHISGESEEIEYPQPDLEPTKLPEKKSGETQVPAGSTPSEEKSEDAPKKAGKKSAKKAASKKRKKAASKDPEEAKKKPNDTPSIRTDAELRGLLLAAQAEMPGATFLQTAKTVFRAWLEKSAYQPPMHCSRTDPETLHTLMGMIAELEKSIKQTIRGIIRAKIDPEKMSELTLKLEEELDRYIELRRTIMRVACVPITPDLPEAIAVGIAALQQTKLDEPHNSAQLDANIEILKSYRPVEYDLPEHLRQILRELRSPSKQPSKP